MSAALEALARDKELLLARSALCRLQLARQRASLRESLRWPRIATAVAASRGTRGALLGVALSLPAIGRTVRLAVTVVRIAVVAKLALSILGHASELGRMYAGTPTLGPRTR